MAFKSEIMKKNKKSFGSKVENFFSKKNKKCQIFQKNKSKKKPWNFFRKWWQHFLRRTHTRRLTPFLALCDTRNTFAFSLKVRFFRFFEKFSIFPSAKTFSKCCRNMLETRFLDSPGRVVYEKYKTIAIFLKIFFGRSKFQNFKIWNFSKIWNSRKYGEKIRFFSKKMVDQKIFSKKKLFTIIFYFS